MNRSDAMNQLALKLAAEANDDRKAAIKENIGLVRKYEKMRLIKNVSAFDDEITNKQRNYARIFENEAAYLKAKVVREAATTADMQGFLAVAFPMVKRVLERSNIEEFVSTQPLKAPAGMIYYLDYNYTTNKAGTGGFLDDGGSPFGGKIGPGQEIPLANTATGGFYQFGNGAYSRREIVSAAQPTGSSAFQYWTGTVCANTTAVAQAVDFDPTALTAAAAGTLVEIRAKGMYASASARAAWGNVAFNTYPADFRMLAAWVPLSATSTATGVLNATTNDKSGYPVAPGGANNTLSLLRALTKIDGDDIVWYATAASTAAAGKAANFKAKASTSSFWGLTASVSFPISSKTAAVSGVEGSFQFTPGFETDFDSQTAVKMPELTFDIRGRTVNTTQRRMKATWTPEVTQDMQALFNWDVEEHLSVMSADHMAVEIQTEILQDLYNNTGAAKFYWSAKPGNFVNHTTGLAASGSPDFTGTPQDWYRGLIECVHKVDAQIQKKTVVGYGNFCITSPEVGVILRNTVHFEAEDEGGGSKTAVMKFGARVQGTLKGGIGSMKVFISNLVPTNKILVGYKPEGTEFEEMLGAGYVYAPYVPIIMSPIVVDPNDGTPRRFLMSRYATELMRNDFYGMVVVQDLQLS